MAGGGFDSFEEEKVEDVKPSTPVFNDLQEFASDELRQASEGVASAIDSKKIKMAIALKRKIKVMEAELKDYKKQYENVSGLLVEEFKSAGVQNQQMGDGITLYINRAKSFSCNNEQKVKFAHETGNHKSLTINAQTFNKLCKEIEERKETLPDYVSYFEKETIRIRGL